MAGAGLGGGGAVVCGGGGGGGMVEAMSRWESVATGRRTQPLLKGVGSTDSIPAFPQMAALPKDELTLRQCGLTSTEGVRTHPDEMSLYEMRLKDNDNLNLPGHVGISRSQEAQTYEYLENNVPDKSDSETEISLRTEPAPVIEIRHIVGGGTLRIATSRSVKAYLLEAAGKLLYAESGRNGALLITSQPNPNTGAWTTNRLSSP